MRQGDRPLFILAYNINKLYNTLGYWSSDMLNFHFSDKGLGPVSPPYSAYDFQEKCLSSYILLTD